MIPLADNGTFRFFLFVIAAKPLNQQILAFFSILLVSRLRLTCSVCDGTLETSYWKCRQWVLRVCKLVNIQNFIFHGHFGAKNHCCAVNHPRPKKNTKIKVSRHQVHVMSSYSKFILHLSWEKCCWKGFEKHWFPLKIFLPQDWFLARWTVFRPDMDQKNTKIEVSPHQVHVSTCKSKIRLHSSWEKCCWKDFEKYWPLFEKMGLFDFFSLW